MRSSRRHCRARRDGSRWQTTGSRAGPKCLSWLAGVFCRRGRGGTGRVRSGRRAAWPQQRYSGAGCQARPQAPISVLSVLVPARLSVAIRYVFRCLSGFRPRGAIASICGSCRRERGSLVPAGRFRWGGEAVWSSGTASHAGGLRLKMVRMLARGLSQLLIELMVDRAQLAASQAGLVLTVSQSKAHPQPPKLNQGFWYRTAGIMISSLEPFKVPVRPLYDTSAPAVKNADNGKKANCVVCETKVSCKIVRRCFIEGARVSL